MTHRSTFRLILVITTLGLVACGNQVQPVAMQQSQAASAPVATPTVSAPAPTPTAIPGQDRLYVLQDDVSVQDRIVVLDGGDGAGERELPFGIPAPDWSVLYAVEPQDGQTVVRAVDPASGRVLRETSLEGEYALPSTTLDGIPGGLSPNGKWLALADVTGLPEPQTYGAHARRQSHFAVLDTAFARPAHALVLDGKFSFDALSNSGNTLYLIEHLLPEQSDNYQVRFYDVRAAALDERIIADKRLAPQLMDGTRHSSVASADGAWLYSIYLNAHHGPFIHALNLNDSYALCIFLPPESKEDWERQLSWAIAMNTNGRIFAVNGALGIVAEVDPAQFTVRSSTSLPVAPAATQPEAHVHLAASTTSDTRIAPRGAALSPDGKTLWASGPTGVLAINTADFSLRGQYLNEWSFDSIALSQDGERLYAVSLERNTILRIATDQGTVDGQFADAHRSFAMLRVEARH
jgi:hypothetical protein